MTTASRALAERHRAILRDQSGIAEDVIGERGYFSVEEFAEARALGFKESQCAVPSMAIPIYDTLGDVYCHVLRHDSPRHDREGKPIKYDWPAGKSLVLDVPPRCRADLGIPDVPLAITEGSKKADALASRGICAVSINGVAGWRSTNRSNGKTALGDWEHIALNGRDVLLIFDSDAMTKQPVAYELHRLCVYLASRKVRDVKVLYLPHMEDGSKQGIDDFFAAGHTVEEMNSYLRPRVEYVIPAKAADGLPNIITNGRAHAQIVNEVWGAVLEQEENLRRIFVRNEVLCHIVRTDAGQPSIADIDTDEWIAIIERAAHALTLTPTGSLIPSRFAKQIARDMLVAWHKPQGLPRLAGIAEAPFFGRDGQLVSAQGYDAATGIYLDVPTSLRGITIPEVPTEEDVAGAVEVWRDVLADFPFIDQADFANALAFGLTPFCRPIFDDVSPMNLVTATTRGSGKGLLINVLNIPAYGIEIRCQNIPWQNDEEVDKRCTSLLKDGVQSIHFDNVEGMVKSPILASFLTSRIYSSRVLGGSTIGSWPQRITSHMSGNNVELGLDIPRRVVPVRLAPAMEHPDRRPASAFRHPNLIRYVTQHRREIVTACLVLIQNWIARGMQPGQETMGSFERWAETLGGILRDAGVEGLLANREEVMEVADHDTGGWHAAVHAWAEKYGQMQVTVAEVYEVIKDVDDGPVMPSGNKEETERGLHMRTGRALMKVRDRIFLGYKIELATTDSHTKQKLWRLRQVGNVMQGTTPNPESSASSDTNAELRGTSYIGPYIGPPVTENFQLSQNVPQVPQCSADSAPCEDEECALDHYGWSDGGLRHTRENPISESEWGDR